MAERPFLLMAPPVRAERGRLGGGAGDLIRPSPARQRERLAPKFEVLARSFEAASSGDQQSGQVTMAPVGVIQEQVIVLETVGSITDFQNAVRRVVGLEWLGEWDEEDIPADEDFARKNGAPSLDGRLYLVMSNQEAMQQLLSLWRTYRDQDNPQWERGTAKWRDLFGWLRDVRFWNAQDRVQGTGIREEWEEIVRMERRRFRAEIELWYRADPATRSRSSQQVRAAVEREGGEVLHEATIDGAQYHGLLAELPISALQNVLDAPATRLVGTQDVMFLRPVGQAAVLIPRDPPVGPSALDVGPAPSPEPPLAALLDGLPLANHALLAGRLTVDDPDDFAAYYEVTERAHGTAMASLMVHGELDSTGPALGRKIYVRPVMRPERPEWVKPPGYEVIPTDVLPVDLLHRAVRRMFEGENGEPPSAPTVKIINWSIGDPSRPFDRVPSSYARTMDWLSVQYGVLFVVSAGNYDHRSLSFDCDEAAFLSLSDDELQRKTIALVADDIANRRLLAPAEAINALTVGAVHTDASTFSPMSAVHDVYPSSPLPSTLSALGPGLRRGVKPDLLAPGGRVLHERVPGAVGNVSLSALGTTVAPGHRVASPGSSPADLVATRYLRGTSNAAALTTRVGAQVAERLTSLQSSHASRAWGDPFTSLLIKALLAHGATWGEAAEILTPVLAPRANGQVKEHIGRFLGYGTLNPGRSLSASDECATLIGWGSAQPDDAFLHSMPLVS